MMKRVSVVVKKGKGEKRERLFLQVLYGSGLSVTVGVK